MTKPTRTDQSITATTNRLRRQHLNQQRRNLSPIKVKLDSIRTSTRVLRYLQQQQPKAKTIASYLSIGNELKTRYLNRQLTKRGHTVSVPVSFDHGNMVFVKYRPFSQQVKGKYGIYHPRYTQQRLVKADQQQLLLVPLVGFDSQCQRLGMGGGYYDRYLPQATQARRLGIAFSVQYTPRLKTEPWDQPLHHIFTPQRQFTRRRNIK